MARSVSAIPVKSVTGARSQDGQVGVLFLATEEAGAGGRERLNLSVKTELLPAFAAVCLGLTDPRRNGQGGRKSRALTPTQEVEVAVASNGQVAITLRLEMNASLSFGLDSDQACALAEALVELAEQVGANTKLSKRELPKLKAAG